MIWPKFCAPFRTRFQQVSAKGVADIKFDLVALAVIKTNGFNLRETIQGPGEAGCGILPAAE